MLFKIYMYVKLFIEAMFKIPSTYLHEASHLIVTVLLRGKIVSNTLFIPDIKVYDNGYEIKFGNIVSQQRYKWAGLFVGLSPFLLWLIPYFYLPNSVIYFNENFLNSNWGWFLHVDNWWFIILFLVVANGAFPSSVDYQVALDGLMSFGGFMIILIIGVISYFEYWGIVYEFLFGLYGRFV